MRKLIIILIIITLPTIVLAKMGKGPIDIGYNFKKGFQEYLEELKGNPKYNGVFVAGPDGAYGYAFAWGSNSWMKAQDLAEENCKKYSTGNCMVFAKGKKIFWKWDQLPDLSFNESQFIDPAEIVAQAGNGNVVLSSYTQSEFEKYKKACDDKNKSEPPNRNVYCYFAISNDGKKSGRSIFTSSRSGGSIIKEAKISAIIECMRNNNKKMCYLYAYNNNVIWENNTSSSSSSSNTSSSTSSSNTSSSSTKKDFSSYSDIGLCKLATKTDGLWDHRTSASGNAVTEARSRNLSLNDCNKLTARGNSEEINKVEETSNDSSTVKTKLKELKSMLDEGLISQEQYDDKSSKILEEF